MIDVLRRHPWRILYLALALDAVCGLIFSGAEHVPVWHGEFCALANAVTDGGDVPPSTPVGYAVTALEYLTVVPLVTAAFSLLTSALTSGHVKEHLAGHERRMKEHIVEVMGNSDGSADVQGQ